MDFKYSYPVGVGAPWVMCVFNPLNAELNPICHLLALLGGATIVVVSRLRVKGIINLNPPSCWAVVRIYIQVSLKN